MKTIINFQLILIAFITIFFNSCNNNKLKQKELELKEKELNLREKEISLSEKEKEIYNLEEKENLVKKEIKSTDKVEKELINQNKKSLNEILIDDFNSLSVSDLPKVWAKRYNILPNKYKHTIIDTSSETYEIQNNENGVESLIRGFSWSCGNNQKMNDLGYKISIDIGYNNQNLTFKAGMVYFYYKYQVLKCKN